MSVPVNYLYTFNLGGRKGSDGNISPSSVVSDTDIIQPDGQWCEYRLQESPFIFAYVDGPITDGAITSSLSGGGFGGWRNVSIELAAPTSLWNVSEGVDVELPGDAMGYIGVEFAPGNELAAERIQVSSRRDLLTLRWSFSISFSSGTGEFGPGLDSDIFALARFHMAITGVNPPEPIYYFWTKFIGTREIP